MLALLPAEHAQGSRGARPTQTSVPSSEHSLHQPVLVNEVLHYLAPRSGGHYVDCTVGAGGHARAILEASAPSGHVLGLDTDMAAIEVARVNLAEFGGRAELVHLSFTGLAEELRRRGCARVDGVVFDLGLSSMQIAAAERGFSFHAEGPLDMRFDSTKGGTAADLLRSLSEQELAELLWQYGEERSARRIARAVVARRQAAPLNTARELGELVAAVVPGGRSAARGIHPATRTFQALRIAVNRELAALEGALPRAVDALAPGGRLAVIAFHSLEDRCVKTFFRHESGTCVCPPPAPVCRCGARERVRVLTRKPVTPSEGEKRRNPRSRSAKLRIAEKL